MLPEFLSSLTSTWGVISTLIAIFSAGMGVVFFLEKRRREDMKTVEVKIGKSSSERDGQFDELEEDLDGVKRRMDALDDRLGSVERNLETVARSSEISALRATLAEHSGAVNSQLKMLHGTVTTLYQAALRAEK